MNIRSLGFRMVRDLGDAMRHEPENGEFFYLFARSRARLTTERGTLELPENSAILLRDEHFWECSAEDCALVCDWMCFDAGNDVEFIDSLELTFGVPVMFADMDFVCGLVRNIAGEFYSLGARRLKMIDSLMRTLLIKLGDSRIFRDAPQQTVDPHYSALIDLRAKIYRNPQLKWNVDTMAADVSMSRSYFQHIYREFFGVSCISDVISSKIEKAKEILSETSCTVSQVAAMCGYENEEHFMRQFKKIVGVTPTRFRRER